MQSPPGLAGYHSRHQRQGRISRHSHSLYLGAGRGKIYDVQTIQETIDFAQRLAMDTVQIMILTPLPGTSFFTRMMAEGEVVPHTYGVKYTMFSMLFTDPGSMSLVNLNRLTGRRGSKNVCFSFSGVRFAPISPAT